MYANLQRAETVAEGRATEAAAARLNSGSGIENIGSGLSRTTRWKGAFLIRRSANFLYFLISRSATVPTQSL
jgi:hypothetical protein